MPWLLLLAAFAGLRENRHWQAIWILLPVVIFRLLWTGFAALTKMPSNSSSLFVSIINCLLIGFVLNWLMGERIGRRNRLATWLLSLLVFGLVFVMTLVNIGLGMEAFQISVFTFLTVGILLLAFALAGFACRKKFGPVRFSIWTAVWVLILTIAFFTGIASIQAMMISSLSFAEILLQVLMVSLVYGVILIAALLPFEIVLFANSFWRKRFEAVFGLRPKTGP